MKRIFAGCLAFVIFLAISTAAFAQRSTIVPTIHVSANKAQTVELNVAGTDDVYILEGNLLTLVDTDFINTTTERSIVPYSSEEQMRNITADVQIYQVALSEQEANALAASDIINPRSGPLSSVKQGQNAMGNIRGTLRVTYSTPIYDGYSNLHLCKATATYENLMPPPNEGVSVQNGELSWGADGKRFINGVQELTTSMSGGSNLALGTCYNYQLMPENVSYYLYGERARVFYDLFCTRNITITIEMPF